jgi:AbrB family looped-hinge helix DNA binding protein
MAEHFLQLGKRGTLVIPIKVRRRLGLEEGSILLLREKEDGLELRKAQLALGLEDGAKAQEGLDRTAEAAQILNSAKDLGEYFAALEEVRGMGLDPDEIPHERFSG